MNKFIVKLPFTSSKRDVCGGLLPTAKKQKTQSCLSFGQKPTSLRRHHCKDCGMFYDAGVSRDIDTHKKECSKISVHGVTKISHLNGHEQVHSYADDCGVVIEWNPSAKNAGSFGGLFAKMNADLGSPPNFHMDAKFIYVYMRGSVAAGSLVVDSIHRSQVVVISSATEDIATPILYSGYGSSSDSQKSDKDSSSSKASVLPDAIPHLDSSQYLGVRQIWISSTFRRQNIASRLVDCARKRFVLGAVVERQNVLFSQPTADGLRLAKSYVGRNYLLVY